MTPDTTTITPDLEIWYETDTLKRKRQLSIDQVERLDSMAEAIDVDDLDLLPARARWTLHWLATAPLDHVAGVVDLLNAARSAGRHVVIEVLRCPCGDMVRGRQLKDHLERSPRHNDDYGGVA